MTLQNGLIYNRTAYVWSDTGVWSETGERIGAHPKVFAGTLWPWVGTWSGASPSGDWNRLANLFSARPNLTPEGLLCDAREVLRLEAGEGRDCRLLLAWPCPKRGARLYHVAAEEMPGREPFEVVHLAKYMSWGAGEDWFAPYSDRDMTPQDMRECIVHQLAANGREVHGIELQDPISDVIETRVSQAGISHHLYRVEGGELRAVEREAA